MRHVYTARDEMEAHFVKGLLEQEGITAVVQGEPLSAAFGELPLSGESLPSVWVGEPDVERAGPIIEEHRRRDAADSEEEREDAPRATWKCGNCAEEVEVQFTECWNCGASRAEVSEASGDPTVGPH